MTVTNVNEPFFLSKIIETWTVVTDNWQCSLPSENFHWKWWKLQFDLMHFN